MCPNIHYWGKAPSLSSADPLSRDAQYPPPSVTSCGWPACHQASHQGSCRCSLAWTVPQLSGRVLLDTKTPCTNPVGGNEVNKGIVSQGHSFETFWTQQAPSFYNSYCHRGQSTSVEITLIPSHSVAGGIKRKAWHMELEVAAGDILWETLPSSAGQADSLTPQFLNCVTILWT